MSEIKSAKQLTTEGPLRVGVYGPNGTGKTTFGATFPKPLFIDADKGLLSIRGKDVDYYSPSLSSPGDPGYISETRAILDWWADIVKDTEKAAKSTTHESIIVDSMTVIGDAALRKILVEAKKQKAGFDEWALFANAIRDYMAIVLNSNKNCLFICHEIGDRDENTGRTWMLPAIQGQMKNKFANYFDEFYHAEVEINTGKPPIYRLLARPSSIYTAKSRLLPAATIDSYLEPSFSKLMLLKQQGK